VRFSGVAATAIEKRPAPYTWPHLEACAWTAAWLTARGRQLVGPREILSQDRWRGQLRWRERGETRVRGHRPDLAGQLPDGRLLPIEVELTEKSAPRLQAIIELHARWITSARAPAVMYVCANDQIAERVRHDAEQAGLSIQRGTLRIELLSTLQREALAARTSLSDRSWHLSGIEIAS
jgi:hypothetical protein